MNLQESDLGWIAGTIDLKGVVIRKRNKQRRTTQTVLMVETRHRPIVERLSDYTGTDPSIQTDRKIKEAWKRKGCVEHCPTQHVHIQETSMPDISRWQVTGSSFVVVMYNVLPHLTKSPKSNSFREAMEEVASTIPLRGQGRAAIDRAIRRLSALGWVIPPYLFLDDGEAEEID